MLNYKTVLVLAPHTDDVELGCGGTIARLVEGGAKVYPVVFAEVGVCRKEMERSSEILGMQESALFDLPIRNLGDHRQKILEGLISLKRSLQPDLVIQPSLNDIHQDHQTVAQEGVRAFKDITLWGYEVPWNNLILDAQLFIGLEDRHVAKKIEAINCYKSQKYRVYMDEDYIKGLMTVRGVQVGVKNAEMFNIIREVIL